MDTNNWRPTQQGGEAAMDAGDWRNLLQPDSRHRIVNKIMETLKGHLPISGPEGLDGLNKIAERFEEKIYADATSQQDYLRKISLKMCTMESKSQSVLPNPLPSNSAGNSNKLPDPGQQNMSSEVPNQGQLPLLASQSQSRHQLLSQNIQNNIVSPGGQSSASLPSALPVTGMTQTPFPIVSGQNSNMQNISGASQNLVGNSMGQNGIASSIISNSLRPLQGRQQLVSQQQQPQPQNSQQYLYQQQLQQHISKHKLQQGNISNSLMQSHVQQQQNLLQPTQLHSSQQSVMQPSMVQSAPLSGLQNQQTTAVQQQMQSLLQQHPQSVLRQQQQQQQQASVLHQQQTPMQQQQQQQQLTGQQPTATNIQQHHLVGQQNNVADIQQQHRSLSQQNSIPNLQQQQLMAQQNNMSNIHKQQLGSQSTISGLHQQQQLLGSQSGNLSMPTNQHSVHMLQQSKVPLQQQTQQSVPNLLQNQGQQPQQQLMLHIQTQPAQLQQQPNSLQRDMQQRLQASGSLLRPQNVIDQPKQLYQSQGTIPESSSTSVESTAQTGQANGGDWQEEVFQKIRSMKEKYLPELNEMYHKIATKMQQHESLPQQPKSDQLDKLKVYKNMLEHIITFLQMSKSNITLACKEKLGSYEKQIINFISMIRPRKPHPSLQQGQLPPSHMHPMQQPQSQITQGQSHENQMNPQLQSMNLQSSLGIMQQNNMTSSQQNSISSLSGVSTSQQNMMNPLPSGSNLDSVQGNAMNSLQQASVQQNPVTAPQQANLNALSSKSGVNELQQNTNPPQPTSNMLQHQHSKQQQEHQMLQTQQLKQQYQLRQMQQQQQYIHKQQMMQQQQQQLLQQGKQQLPAQLHTHQMPQLQQMNDVNDTKMRQGMNVKPGVFQQHQAVGQHSVFPHQQLKSGSPYPISSPQLLQGGSLQIPQHSSPQIDQQNLLTSLTKAGTPLQSANSPFVVQSPSTPLAPSPMPGDSEKLISGVPALSNGTVGHQQTNSSAAATSLAIGTPGISASPLLAEVTGSDGTHGNVLANVSGKSSVTEQPLERLIKVVKSLSAKALSASVNDIGSVVSMIDRIAGSAPGNGSRAAAGEDLVALTKCRLQAKNFSTQDGTTGSRKMRRYLNIVSSVGSINDNFEHFPGSETSDLESTATSGIKRPRIEANHILLEEIREINQQLIDTMVNISDEDADPIAAAAEGGEGGEGGEGTLVKCSFSAVALSPNLKLQYASAQMSPIQPLWLLVPTNYPNCSPILLDKFPVEVSKEYQDLSVKAKSRLSISLRSISQPMSLGEIARTWDVCARTVISEFAQQSGGGSFSSKFGSWENCLSAA